MSDICPVCNQWIDDMSNRYTIAQVEIYLHEPCAEWLIVELVPRHECEICWKTVQALTGIQFIKSKKRAWACDECLTKAENQKDTIP